MKIRLTCLAIGLVLAILVLVACEPKLRSIGGKEVELELVWEIKPATGGVYSRIYEFYDYERGEHCYVMYYSGDRSGLSCRPIER